MRFHIRWTSFPRAGIPATAKVALTTVGLLAALLAGEAGKRWV